MNRTSNLAVTIWVCASLVAAVSSCKPSGQERYKSSGRSQQGVKSDRSADAAGRDPSGDSDTPSASTGGSFERGSGEPEDHENGVDPLDDKTGSDGDEENDDESNSDADDDGDKVVTGSNGLVSQTAMKGPGTFAQNFNSSADFFTNMQAMIEGKSPHGTVRIWYSSNVKQLIRESTFTVPEGTVAIKKYKNSDGAGYAVMVKKSKGYDSANGDWYYEMRNEAMVRLDDPKPGKIEMCISCHAAASAKDFLAGTEVGSSDVSLAGDASHGPGEFKSDFAHADGWFTATQSFVGGRSPHGKVRIWYSSNAKHLIGNAELRVPTGTVAIKEFNNDSDPGVDGVAVMIKKEPGYDTANNDWHYEMRDQWGVLKRDPEPGRIVMCIGCHAAASATDYLAGTKVSSSVLQEGGEGPGVFLADYYDSGMFFTQMSKMVSGSSPHGNGQIWYSSNVKERVKSTEFTVPTGTVAIKRFENGEEQGLAVMIKQPSGFDSLNGDWRYEMRDRYGNLMMEPVPGHIETCVSCHKSDKKTDYLSGTKVVN